MSSTKITYFLVLIMVLLPFESTRASSSVDIKRYYRCFSIFMRERVQANDLRLKYVKTGDLSGTDACMMLLENGNLDPDSGLLARDYDYDTINKYSFKSTLHKITSQKCISCHGDNAPRARHASNDLSESLTEALSLVDFDNIQSSRIVRKISNGHNCWSDCGSNANELAKAITKWRAMANDFASEDLFSDEHGYNNIGKKVLKFFSQFHSTWFPQFDFRTAPSSQGIVGTGDIYDSSAMSYYVTRSVLSASPFRDFVSLDQVLKAERISSYERSPRLIGNLGFDSLFIGKSNDIWSNPPLIELGEIVGISPRESYYDSRLDESLETKGYDLFEGFGAGVVSDPSYLILNSEFRERQTSDGGLKVPRRWARAVYKDLFCRELPVVRSTDAIKFVDKTNESELPFRSGISCMKCHSSIDPLARVARGVYFRRTGSARVAPTALAMMVHNREADLPSHPDEFDSWVDQSDRPFYRRPHFGKLYYRTTDGKLVDETVEGFDQLGDLLAKQDDLYKCASKRYVNLLTGVNIDFFDVGDVTSPVRTEGDKAYLGFIDDLARDLKTHQNPKRILRKIIDSKAFVELGGRP